MKRILSVLAVLSASMLAAAQNGPVKMWEGTIDLPTYRVNAPEKAPLFERDFAYQRAKRGVYPYAMNDNPTLEKVDSTHRALYLENDYIKVCVLPDIGGRIRPTDTRSFTARRSSSPRTWACWAPGSAAV